MSHDGRQPYYRRVLLKMSGEALMGEGDSISPSVLTRMTREIAEAYQLGVQIAIVIGGGNFFRGKYLSEMGVNRVTADHMGMLGTLMNALALRDAFEQGGLPVRILSALPVAGVVEGFERRKALHHLQEGRIVIFAAGTGNPLVTTDSAASLRGIEIEADVILKATRVDGIYNRDPLQDPSAQRYQRLTYSEVLERELGVMDLAAFCQCRDYHMKLRVFNFLKPGALMRVILGEDEGTEVA